MALSNDLISQFAKLTIKKEKTKPESTVYGTIKEYNGEKYVKLDGSDLYTPISSTTLVNEDERVVVSIKHHTATVMGNITSPSAQNKDVEVLSANVGEFGTALADTVKTNQLTAEQARIDILEADAVSIKNELNANNVLANEIKTENIEIKNELIAQDARIDKLVAEGIDVTELEAKFANIDFSNIGSAAISKFFSDSGLIKDVVVGDGTVTGELVGVTIKGDLIEGGTVKADKLVILGTDGLYYKLNTNGVTTEAEQTVYNSLDGSHIIAKSITASKVDVEDLVAFGATIGGFIITNDAIYSGVKDGPLNTSRGIYLDDSGQFSIGDATHFLRYYYDEYTSTYKLELSSDSIKMGGSNLTIKQELDTIKSNTEKTVKNVDLEYYLSDSSSQLTGGTWRTEAPEWVDGKYMWSRVATTLTNGTLSTSEPTCITGAKGEKGDTGEVGPQGIQGVQGEKGIQGIQGPKGDTGDAGVGILSITEYYQVSTSNSTAPTSWLTSVPVLSSSNKYLWNYEVVKMTDNSTKETAKRVIGVYGDKGSTGSTGAKGDTGATGKGIKSIVNYYLATASSSGVTISTTGWTLTVQSVSSSKKYLWNYETVTYTDNSTASTTPCVIGAYGDKGATGSQGPQGVQGVKGDTGAKGDPGAAGKGIKSITNYYLATTASSNVTTSTSGWTTSIQSITSSKRYLWNYEVVAYTDNSTTATTPAIIGVWGNTGSTGATGAAGKGISSITEYYLASASASGVTTSTSGWSTSVQATTTTNKYLWNYEKIAYSDGTSTNTTCRIIGTHGATGSTGATGATGTGVESITEEYYISTSKTSQTGGSWSTSTPTWSTGKYIWTRSKIVYKNPASTVYTTPICDSSWEAVNEVDVGGRNYIRFGKGDVKDGFFTNFSKVENGYGEHTLTSKKTYSNISIGPGFVLGCRDYEVGKQVTFSFDIMFTDWNLPTGASIGEWWIGQRYSGGTTESSTGAWRSVTNNFAPPRVGVNGCVLNEWTRVEKTMVIPEQAHSSISTAASIQFYNSNADVEASITFRIRNVKLEYGNKATDWTPAPEDVDSGIKDAYNAASEAQGTADSVESRMTTAEQTIDSILGYISSLVVDSNGQSLMTQTGSGWQYSIAGVQDSVDSIATKLGTLTSNLGSTEATVETLKQAVSDLEETAEYVRIKTYEDEPCIELGESDSNFKLLITNTRIMFMSGSDVPTYISNRGLETKNIEVKNELRQGNFIWSVRPNGNYGLQWKEISV